MSIHDLCRKIKKSVDAVDELDDELVKNGEKYLSEVELFEFKNEVGCIHGKLLNLNSRNIEKMDKG